MDRGPRGGQGLELEHGGLGHLASGRGVVGQGRERQAAGVGGDDQFGPGDASAIGLHRRIVGENHRLWRAGEQFGRQRAQAGQHAQGCLAGGFTIEIGAGAGGGR